MKIIYLVRHSSPFVEIDNYEAYENVLWNEYNKNMILSVQGEEKAQKLCEIEELKNIKNIYSSNSFRAIATAKYLSESNKTKIKLDDRIKEEMIIISGNKQYIDKMNKNIAKYLNKIEKQRKVTIINCYEVMEFNENIHEILSLHDKILNTSGEKEIGEIFDGYQSKRDSAINE